MQVTTQENNFQESNFTESTIHDSTTQPYRVNLKKTLLYVVITTFLLMFLLVFGSFTENRFGTHLVFNSDLNSSPPWFILSISIISIIFLLYGFILFNLNSRGLIQHTKSIDKNLKITSLFLIGVATLFLGISSFSFAGFNSQFYISQINSEMIYNGKGTSVQAMIIGISTVVFLGAILITSITFTALKIQISEKNYFTYKSTGLLLIGLTWFMFITSIVTYGAFGGDAMDLIEGITGKEISSTIANSTGQQAWDYVIPHLDKTVGDIILSFNLGPDIVIKGAFIGLWENGVYDPIGTANDIFLDEPIRVSLSQIGKEEMLYGVNDSVSAKLLLFTTASAVGVVVAYMIYLILLKDQNSDSDFAKSVNNISKYLIFGTTILFLILIIIYPYVSDSFAPGVIAPFGKHGGVYSAYVYYLPNYYGTASWDVALALLLLIPIASVFYELIIFRIKKLNALK